METKFNSQAREACFTMALRRNIFDFEFEEKKNKKPNKKVKDLLALAGGTILLSEAVKILRS